MNKPIITLDENRIREHIKSSAPEIRVFSSIDSTNNEAKRVFRSGDTRETVYTAEAQTSGRGRSGRSFYSPESTGLYFSAVLSPNVSLEDATLLTSAAAVAVCDALWEVCKVESEIKWVNDIYIGSKKVCGILTESIVGEGGTLDAVVVGIGINITTEYFPAELDGVATSLRAAIDRNELLGCIYDKLRRFSDALPEKSFLDRYREKSLVIGREITFERNGSIYTAVCKNIDDSCALTVTLENGEESALKSGEISIKLV